jgi:hypothetical protein
MATIPNTKHTITYPYRPCPRTAEVHCLASSAVINQQGPVEIFGDQAMTGIFVRIGPNVDYTIQLYNRHACQNVAFLGAFDLLGLTLSMFFSTSDPSGMDHADPFSKPPVGFNVV